MIICSNPECQTTAGCQCNSLQKMQERGADEAWDDAVEVCAELCRSNLFLPPAHREAIAKALISSVKGKRDLFSQASDDKPPSA